MNVEHRRTCNPHRGQIFYNKTHRFRIILPKIILPIFCLSHYVSSASVFIRVHPWLKTLCFSRFLPSHHHYAPLCDPSWENLHFSFPYSNHPCLSGCIRGSNHFNLGCSMFDVDRELAPEIGLPSTLKPTGMNVYVGVAQLDRASDF